jgi:hypothetical protein
MELSSPMLDQSATEAWIAGALRDSFSEVIASKK